MAAALLLAAEGKVWHFWLAVFQAIPFLIICAVIGVLYLTKVVSRRYPRQ